MILSVVNAEAEGRDVHAEAELHAEGAADVELVLSPSCRSPAAASA